jgi:hypothetical protein
MAVRVMVAGDQDPGHRPITSQPPTSLRIQRSGPAQVPTEAAGAAQEAVEVHRHEELGADPTRLGQPAALQGPAG